MSTATSARWRKEGEGRKRQSNGEAAECGEARRGVADGEKRGETSEKDRAGGGDEEEKKSRDEGEGTSQEAESGAAQSARRAQNETRRAR